MAEKSMAEFETYFLKEIQEGLWGDIQAVEVQIFVQVEDVLEPLTTVLVSVIKVGHLRTL